MEQERTARARRGATLLKPATMVPVLVFSAIGATLAWSAWPTLRPATTVEVTQAVFVRAASEQMDIETPAERRRPSVQAPGWLEGDPYFVACTALADGVVESIAVLEGDSVRAGQVVARMVSEDAELRVRRAEAEAASAQARLQLTEADLRQAEDINRELVDRERTLETARARLAETDAELAQLPLLVNAARATLVRFKEELTRVEASLARGAASDIEAVILRQQVASQEATVASLEARRPIFKAQRARWAAETRAAERHIALRIEERRAIDAGRAAFARAQADVMRTEAMLDEARLELSRMTIRAPIDGVVQRRLKVPGDKVMLGMDSPHSAHLVHLYDPARIQVRVDIPLADAAHVLVGQRCEVVVEVLPDEVFAGEVTRITHEADLQKNTLQAKVRVIDPSPLLRPEMLTRVKFIGSGEASSAPTDAGDPGSRVRVPSEAIDARGPGAIVWAVRDRRGDRGVVRPISVEVIERGEDAVLVRGALRAGEVLAIGFDGLRGGEAVRVSRGGGAS
ncbi:MAG: efflux RND transporter periplasmic adaptor subunit [Planctomycetota bacterium]